MQVCAYAYKHVQVLHVRFSKIDKVGTSAALSITATDV